MAAFFGVFFEVNDAAEYLDHELGEEEVDFKVREMLSFRFGKALESFGRGFLFTKLGKSF